MTVAAHPGSAVPWPWQIPARRWWAILRRTYDEVQSDRMMAVAGGVVFYVLLAMVPAISVLVSVYALFADPTTIRDHLAVLAQTMPASAFDVVGTEIARIAGQDRGALSLAFGFSLLLALWSANSGTKAMFDALNVAFDRNEERNFIALNLESLGFTLAAVVVLILALAAVVVVPLVLGFVGINDWAEALLSLLRWPILLLVVGLALGALYRYGPSMPAGARGGWITIGSVTASLLWLVVSAGFSWYLGSFADYNATYGSLGAVIGLMIWLWLSFSVVLAGAELDKEIENELAPGATARSTHGVSK